ncbi:MAG: hypothetical protein U0V48_14200 [Anaerolineales bacterium]
MATETNIQPTLTSTSTLQPVPTPSSTPVSISGTIVFTSISQIHGGISLLNLRDGSIQNITGTGSDSVSWSQDGQWIAFNGEIPPAQNGGVIIQSINLFIIKPDGSEYKRLTQSSQGKSDVNWSPDGKFLVYVYENQLQPSDLAIFDFDRNATYLLSSITGYERHPVWSPDGKHIAFLHAQNIDQPSELWIIDADGKNAKRVLEFNVATSRIDWSPDGQWIAFISTKNSQQCGEIYMVRIDGTELTQLTDLPGCATNVTWSPDGKRLAFVEQKDDFNNFKKEQSQISIIDIFENSYITLTLGETWRINDIDWKPN